MNELYYILRIPCIYSVLLGYKFSVPVQSPINLLGVHVGKTRVIKDA